MSNTIFHPLFFFFFFFFLLLSPISTHHPPLLSSTCKSTPNPHLCRWMLSTFKPSNKSSPSKFSIKQSLKHATTLSKLINHHPDLTTSYGSLSDCAHLFQLNVDYLQRIMHELGRVKKSYYADSTELVGRVEALLSGVVTNQQTCYDGIIENGGWDGKLLGKLHEPVVNGTQLYSVSLGIVTHAFNRFKIRRKRHYHPSFTGPGLRRSDPDFQLPKILQLLQSKSELGFIESLQKRREKQESYNGLRINDVVTVSQYDENANFTSISEAIEFAPSNMGLKDGYFVIYIKEGYYEEYVTISRHKKGIMLLGDGINQTIISGNRSVFDGWTTFNSATFAVSGERFVAIGITFMNTAGPEKHQAVAVRNNADLSTFYKCSFIGYQDTLYAHSMRQFYRECDIYGTIDFIFGNAACVFQNCNLNARKPMPNQKNVITAQGRSDPNQNTGISIHNCTIQAAPDLALDLNSTLSYLGRPWHDYSRTVFMQSYIDDVIDPVGWLAWNDTSVDVDNVFYAEFDNYGPGAETSMRVQWNGFKLLNQNEALNFTVTNFMMGDTWLHYANVPYTAGLM